MNYGGDIPEFDHRAVREAIVNAFARRDDARLGRVLLRMEADGLTVSNPGGFIEGVTFRNILNVQAWWRQWAMARADLCPQCQILQESCSE